MESDRHVPTPGEEEPLGDPPEPTSDPTKEGAATSEEVHKRVLVYLAGRYGPELFRDFTRDPHKVAEEVGVSTYQLRDWMFEMIKKSLEGIPTDNPIDVLVELVKGEP